MIGIHTVFVYPDRDEPTGEYEDISCLIDELAIAYGRTDTTGQPDPSACTIDLTVSPDEPLPAMCDIGAWIVVDTELAGTTYRRFTGRITDVGIGWEDMGPDTPEAGSCQIVAVSPLADYARRIIGDEPFPQELDGARVARVFALAGLILDPGTSDPGIYQIVPRDVDAKAALEIAADTALSAGGLIWETTTGDIRYADIEHRRGTDVSLDLDACDILVSPTWLRNVSGLVNDLTITYGVAPVDPPEGESTEQPTYRDTNDASKAKYGRYEYSATVELADLADVEAAANLILTQNAGPVWMLQELPLDVFGLSLAQTEILLGLQLHDLIRVGGLPATGSTPTSVVAWIEGWTVRLAFGVDEISLIVSDYCRTSPPPRWNDIPPEQTWDTTDPALTWDSVACLGPPVDLGTWDSVPATTRWDQVPADVEWDETSGGVPDAAVTS